MAFTTYDELYKYFSSDRLSTVSQSYKKKVLEAYRKVHKWKFSSKQIAEKYGTTSEIGLAIQFFYESELFYESPSYDDDDRTDEEMKKYKEQSKFLFLYATRTMNSPRVPEYAQFCEEVNTIIETALLKEFDEAGIKGLITDIDAALQDYAMEVSNFYDDKLFDPDHQAEADRILEETCLDVTTRDVTTYKDGNFIDSDDAQEIQKLYDFASDKRLPDEVIKYMLNPVIGTAGLALNEPTRCPIYTTILPQEWLILFAKDAWNRRATKMDPKPLIPSGYTDNFQTRCQTAFFHKFSSTTMTQAMDEKMKQYRSKDEGDDNDNAAPGMSTSTSGPSATGTGKGTSGGATPGATSSGATPTIPDDSTYSPDLMLEQKAKEYTEAFRADTKYAAHDFMTRFNTNSEMYVGHSIPDYEMRRSNPDADWFISTMMSGRSTFYIVTFSRKSKKPIFSVVI